MKTLDELRAAGREKVVANGSARTIRFLTQADGPLGPDVMYIVGSADRHSMHAITDLHLVTIFNPPLQGDEQHDPDGTLPPSGPLPPGPKR